MKLKITSDQTLTQVKEAFHKLLPFMKIEFFHHSHTQGEGSPKADMIEGNIQIAELIKGHDPGTIEFNYSTLVYELESKLQDYFGLNVQIFRKSGRLWLESTVSDNWTLEKVKQESEEFESI
jgi:hypothetical protein